jgi:hypothetical protein
VILIGKSKLKSIVYLLLFLTIPYWFDYFLYYFNWIIDNKDNLRYGLTAMFVLLGLMLNAKAKINDGKLVSKLITEFGGRDRLVDVLIRLAKMLELMNSKELFDRILMVSEIELDMRIQIQNLNDIINVSHKDNEIDFDFTKKQQKKLQKKIRNLLEIIDHKVEEEKLPQTTELSIRLKKDLIHQKNIDEKYRKPQEKRIGSMFSKFPKYK